MGKGRHGRKSQALMVNLPRASLSTQQQSPTAQAALGSMWEGEEEWGAVSVASFQCRGA